MSAQIINFHQIRLARKAVESENTLAATWSELWSEFFDIWGSACMETIDMVRQTQLAYVAILEQIVFMERREEAEYSGRLIREVTGE